MEPWFWQTWPFSLQQFTLKQLILSSNSIVITLYLTLKGGDRAPNNSSSGMFRRLAIAHNGAVPTKQRDVPTACTQWTTHIVVQRIRVIMVLSSSDVRGEKKWS
ncbi:hypothetical protein L1887_29145 [Cichorium endivia]|nr:hypothetical protein L1887_29145 [Cichorium endivia]